MVNGKVPYKGARMYDILHGTGEVVKVEPDMSFELKFSGGRTFRYSNGGMVGMARRVYWSNPIIVEPEDNSQLWSAFVNVAKPIYTLLKQTVSKGN